MRLSINDDSKIIAVWLNNEKNTETNHNDRKFEANLELENNKNSSKLEKESESSNDIKEGSEKRKTYENKTKGQFCSNDIKEGEMFKTVRIDGLWVA